jgi:hypothetical protein
MLLLVIVVLTAIATAVAQLLDENSRLWLSYSMLGPSALSSSLR